MNLYILRHASAGTSRTNPLLDAKRPIDREGKQHCQQLAYVLNALKINFDLVLSSPLKRALQTAQLVATETGYEAKIQLAPSLAPDATFAQFSRLLDEHRDREEVLVVGHNPNLQGFLGALLVAQHGEPTEDHPPEMAQVRLRKGALARLSVTRGPATLQTLLEPRVVRALYSTSTKSSRRKTSRK